MELADILAISGGVRSAPQGAGDAGVGLRILYGLGCLLCLAALAWWSADAGYRAGFGPPDDE